MNKKQGRSDWTSVGVGAAVGAGGSMALTLALSALAANLISREVIAEASLDVITAAILILSSACGAVAAVRVTGHHMLPVCMATGGIYYIVLLSCAALFFDGAYSAVGVTGLTILGCCGAAALLGLKDGRKNRGYRHPKNRNWKVVQNHQRGN